MANTDKDIVITPNRGSSTADPTIRFTGGNASVAASVNVSMYADGTLSFDGTAGQLFSITNSLTGTIFSVNDVSGIPSIEVLDTGVIKLAQYNGNVGIGTATVKSGVELAVFGGNIQLGTSGRAIEFPDGTLQTTAYTGASGLVTTFSAGTTGFTPSTATSGAITLAGTLVAANGGTGNSSYTIGDILYASGATALSKLVGVPTGNALISGGTATAPSWGKIGLTTHVTGTLPVANGGTGLTSGTSGGVLYYSAAGTLASSGALAASALVVGGGAGVAPSTITTGTGVTTALGVNTGSAGAFVVNGGVLGTPSSGTLTNCTFPTLNQNTTGYAAGIAGGVLGNILYQTGANATGFVGVGTSGWVLTGAGSALPQWTQATNANTASTIVQRDASGNFSSGIITANSFIPSSATAPTNGMYLPAANTLGFSTNSIQRMVIDSSGNVGIGTSLPDAGLTVSCNSSIYRKLKVGDYASPGTFSMSVIESLGSRNDANQTFGGRICAAYRRADGTAISSGTYLGFMAFGGQHGTSTSYVGSDLLYSAAVMGIAESSFTSNITMSTALAFTTGSTGYTSQAPNITYGTERMRISSSGSVGIGTSTMTNRLEVWGGNVDIAQTGFGIVFPDNTFQTTAYTGAAGLVTTFSAGTTGLTPSTATSGAITLAGTLAVANGGTGLTTGTSGGVLYYSAAGTLASSGALTASALVVGGGAGVAPSTITTGTGVVTALGVAVGSAGAFVTFNGALGTPSSGTLTNCTFPTLNPNTTGYAAGIAGGALGQLHYQTGANATGFVGVGTSGWVLTGAGSALPQWTQATNANTASTIVQRDASGNFSAGTITASLTGTASTATNVAGGSAGAIHYQSGAGTTAFVGIGTAGYVLTGAGAALPQWTQATNSNTASTIVQRDASGNFSAGTITASLTGTASTATNVAGGALGQIHYQTGAGTTGFVGVGTSGWFLTGAGSALPQWTQVVPVANGGTGLSSGTSGGILYYSATGTLASSGLLTQYGVVYGGGAGATPVATAAGTTGQLLTATTSGAPSWGLLDIAVSAPDLSYKKICDAATIGTNITLSAGAPSTLDGVTLALNNRILVKDQTAPAENGIYYVTTLGTGANGTWTRAVDADAAGDIDGATVAISKGTVNGGRRFVTYFKGTDTLGSTAMYWNRVVDVAASSQSAIPTTAIGIDIATPSDTINLATGSIADLAMNSFAGRTITATGASTYTRAATVYIGGAPTASTNATFTNSYALYVAGGASAFAGNVSVSGSITSTGSTGNITGVNNLSTVTVTATGAITGTAFIPTGSTVPANGMYLPSAGTLGFATNSTQVMTINTSGNVGIGTTNPLAQFVVGSLGSSGGESTYGGIMKMNTSRDFNAAGGGTLGDGGLEFKSNVTTNGTGWIISSPLRSGTNVPLSFGYRNNSATWTELVTMRSDTGRVGIGTVSPGTTLQIGTDLAFDYNFPATGFNHNPSSATYITTNTASLIQHQYSGGLNGLCFATFPSGTAGTSATINTNVRMIINPTGNVGIGTTSPSNILSIFGGNVQISNNSNNVGIIFSDGTFMKTASSGGGTITDDNATNTTQYPLCARATSGTLSTVYTASTDMYFNPSTGTLNAVIFNSLSDVAVKTNIEPVINGLNVVSQLQGVGFNWKDNGRKSYGVIAQELERILPELVDVNTDNGNKSVNYSALSAFFIEAIKELSNKVDELNGIISNLRKE